MQIELRVWVASSFFCVGALACSSSSPAQPVSEDAGTLEASVVLDAGAGHDAADAAVTAATIDCTTYCTTAMKNCNPVGQGYPNQANCLAHCNALPIGTMGDTEDTVACRQAHALAAATNALAECPMAGPFPRGACGTPCDAFCAVATAACGDEWGGACADTCAHWADDGTTGSLESTSGDSLNCRRYYVEQALEHAEEAGDAGDSCASVGTQSAACK